MKRIFIPFITLICILSCGKKEIKTKNYYFPYAQFTGQKIYKYVNANDSTKCLYWHFNTQTENGDTLFSTGIFNTDFVLTSVFVNSITEDGVELREMYINTGDSNKLYKCEIKSNEVMNWKLQENQPIFLSYAISNAAKTETEEVVTERSATHKKEAATFSGKEHQCLVIKEKTLINHIKVNRTQTEEQERNSFFAENIGLIRFETYYANGTTDIYNLDKILSLDEWKKILPQPKDSIISPVN